MEQVSEVTEWVTTFYSHIQKKAFSTNSRQPFICLREQSGTCSSSRCRSQRTSHFHSC